MRLRAQGCTARHYCQVILDLAAVSRNIKFKLRETAALRFVSSYIQSTGKANHETADFSARTGDSPLNKNTSLILLNNMDFQIIKVDGFYKAVLIKPCFVPVLKFFNVVFQPDWVAQIELTAYFFQTAEYLACAI